MTDPQDHAGFDLANQQDRQTVVAMVCTALAGAVLYAAISITFYGCFICNSPKVGEVAGASFASPTPLTGDQIK